MWDIKKAIDEKCCRTNKGDICRGVACCLDCCITCDKEEFLDMHSSTKHQNNDFSVFYSIAQPHYS